MTTVSRRKFIASAGAGTAAAASTLAVPAIAQSAPEVKWRCTASWPKTIALYDGPDYMAKRLAEMTDGKFQLQLFAAGEIVPGLQVLDAVQNGTVECGHTAPYYYFGKDDTFTFGSDLPFGMNSRMKNAYFFHGGGLELFNEFQKTFNIYGVPMGSTNCQMGGWFRKEIKTVDDLKGLKFRLGGFAGKIVSRLGVVPQQIAGGDIYPALEKGTIDAAEWVGPYDDEKLGFVKVAKYYYYPGWWEPGSNPWMYVNLEKWNSLPKNYKAMFLAAAQEAGMWMTAKYDAENPAALKRLVGAGAQLRPFPPEVMEACWKASNDLYAELNKSNPWFKKMYDHFTAYRGDQYLMWQLADYTMDTYMIHYRNKG